MNRLRLGIALACLPAMVTAQRTPGANAHPDSFISWVARQLPSVRDSAAVFAVAHRSVMRAKAANAPQSLGQAYENLATWHQAAATIDSTLHYLQLAEAIYQEQDNWQHLAQLYLQFENALSQRGQYAPAETYAFKALELYEREEDQKGICRAYLRLSDLFYYQDNYDDGKAYAQMAITLAEDNGYPILQAIGYRYLANNQLFADEAQDALPNALTSVALLEDEIESGLEKMASRNSLGNILKYLERYDEALEAYQENLEKAKNLGNQRFEIVSLANIGHVYLRQAEYETALPYFLQAIALMETTGQTKNLWENYMHASIAYEEIGDFENALKYDILYGRERMAYLQSIIDRLESELQVKYETQKKEETIALQEERIARQRTTQFLYLGLSVLLAAFLVGMFVTIGNIRKKRKKLAQLNAQLHEERAALNLANANLTETIANLKAAQAQLIQSEKMASLGELTAGIAHEIQNPLNFVNNFSEISQELIGEISEAIEKGQTQEANLLLKDVAQNLEKIHHHGTRADAIVKGMLQHSRKSSTEKEPTNINQLADEYLRLAYHGKRAKDKSFNLAIETSFDESIGLIEVMPQDMGRVLLNLITNAFYAANQKKQRLQQAGSPLSKTFQPTVSVITKKEGNQVLLTVKDNGDGIPSHLLGKIFQPFFTTKPTGEGTGLGLSLSYDIVKAHGGELRVFTEGEKGTEFVISLPINH